MTTTIATTRAPRRHLAAVGGRHAMAEPAPAPPAIPTLNRSSELCLEQAELFVLSLWWQA